MLVELKKIGDKKKAKDGWKTLEVTVKPLNKKAKQLCKQLGKTLKLSVAPDNLVKFRKGRELILTKPRPFFGTLYFRLSDDERAKNKDFQKNKKKR